MRLRKGDVVEIIAGHEVGKRGKILKILNDTSRVIVEGINFVYKHERASRRNPQGGRVQREASVHQSNILPVCNKCNRGIRIKNKTEEGNRKVRVCTVCGGRVGVE